MAREDSSRTETRADAKRMTMLRTALLAGLVCLAVSGCSGITTVVHDEKQPEQVVDRFVQAMQEQRAEDAYALLAPDRQKGTSLETFSESVKSIAAGGGAIVGHEVTGSHMISQKPLRVGVEVVFDYRQSPDRTIAIETIKTPDDGWRVNIGRDAQ